MPLVVTPSVSGQGLTHMLDNPINHKSSDHARFSGSNYMLDFGICVFAHLYNGNTVVGAIFTIQAVKTHAASTSVFRCFLQLDVKKQPTVIRARISPRATSHLAEQAFLLHRPVAGQTLAVTFPGKTFDADETLGVVSATFRMEKLQLAIPVKYSVLAPVSLTTFNDPDMSDCAIVPKDSAEPIHVSRAILARASPFFVTMFKGNWAEFFKSNTPINFGWPASALLPCLVHIYSGWVIGEALPGARGPNVSQDNELNTLVPLALADQLFEQYGVDVKALTVHQLLELMDLARLLEGSIRPWRRR